MKKFTSFLRSNFKTVIAILGVLILTVVLIIWGVFSYKKNAEIRNFGLEKINIVNITSAQGFILNKQDWASVPNPQGFEIVEMIDEETPLKKKLSNGYTLYISQIGVINVVSSEGEKLEFDLSSVVRNYFSSRKQEESFDTFEFKADEMTLFAEGAFRVKIYPKYFSFVIGRDKSAPNVPLKFLTRFGFYILVGKI